MTRKPLIYNIGRRWKSMRNHWAKYWLLEANIDDESSRKTSIKNTKKVWARVKLRIQPYPCLNVLNTIKDDSIFHKTILFYVIITKHWYDPGHKIRSVRVDGEQTESRNSTLFGLKFNTIKITIESFCGRRTTVFRNNADELSIFFASQAWKPCTKRKGRSIQRPCSTIYARVRCSRW